MIYPAINDLLEKAGSRYALVNVVAKRAREVVEGTPIFIATEEKKPVTISTLEVFDGVVSYEAAHTMELQSSGLDHERQEEIELINNSLPVSDDSELTY